MHAIYWSSMCVCVILDLRKMMYMYMIYWLGVGGQGKDEKKKLSIKEARPLLHEQEAERYILLY